MKVVILAGGMGTRLRPLTFSIPKPLLPVDETPILEIILSKLKAQGFTDIVLCVGYKSDLIKTYFGDGSRFGVDIKYVEEDQPMGTAGPLGIVNMKFKIDEPIILMNGDILTKFDFKKMINFHNKNKADITVAIKKHQQKSPFGVIDLEGDNIIGIKEKPTISFNVSAGIYVISPSALDLIPNEEFCTMPDMIKSAIDKGKKIVGYRIKEYWIAVEHMDNYKEALKEIEKWK
ncbi:MAG: nucleotidyltransferase family protein [Planctomycetota bacterium]|jgi:NDP-sugar pyrophosphorylase family protein